MIPTAEMMHDGEVRFGLNYENRHYNLRAPGQYHQLSCFAAIGYLPFVEVVFRLTRHLNYPRRQALGDRMTGVRIRFLKESNQLPAVVLGAQDVVGRARQIGALYVVSSKKVFPETSPYQVTVHMGYGTNRPKAQHHQYVGLFGGLCWSFMKYLDIMLEHDADKVNFGVRLRFHGHAQILVALLKLTFLSGGLSVSFRL